MENIERWETLVYHGEVYDGFEVSDCGKIRNVKTGTVYKTYENHNGYLQVCVSLGSRKSKKVFRINIAVACTFIPNTENKPEVNHKDGNKLNNNASNLEWVTSSENMRHAYDNGLQKPLYGTNNPASKLSKEDVEFIRNNYIPRDKIYGARALGRMFNISHTKILNVINNESYINI